MKWCIEVVTLIFTMIVQKIVLFWFLDTTQYFRQLYRYFWLKCWRLHGSNNEKSTGGLGSNALTRVLCGIYMFLLSLNKVSVLSYFSLTSHLFNSLSSAVRGSPWWKPPSWWSVSSSSLIYFSAWRELKMKHPRKSTYTRFVHYTMHACARNNLKYQHFSM